MGNGVLRPDGRAERAADRALAGRRAEYLGEIARIVDATYSVMERTGSVDPTIREILAEAGLSTQSFYRHFRGKEELFLAILDDGRRLLAEYLDHQMSKATSSSGRVAAWIAGVLAQATDPRAAARTRPFLVNSGRLADRFPEEQRVAETIFIDQLAAVIESTDPERDAIAIYQMAFGVMEWHILRGSAPTQADIDHLIGFATRPQPVGSHQPPGTRRGPDHDTVRS